jgi:hypothetical protein
MKLWALPMLTQQFGHFKYISLFAAILLVFATAQDSFQHHHHYALHFPIHYDEDFQQTGNTSVDDEIQKVVQFYDYVATFAVSLRVAIRSIAPNTEDTPATHNFSSSIRSRESPI